MEDWRLLVASRGISGSLQGKALISGESYTEGHSAGVLALAIPFLYLPAGCSNPKCMQCSPTHLQTYHRRKVGGSHHNTWQASRHGAKGSIRGSGAATSGTLQNVTESN